MKVVRPVIRKPEPHEQCEFPLSFGDVWHEDFVTDDNPEGHHGWVGYCAERSVATLDGQRLCSEHLQRRVKELLEPNHGGVNPQWLRDRLDLA